MVQRRLGSVLGVLTLVALASATTRAVLHQRLELPDRAGWVAFDPDTLYHARRVQRVFEQGLPVASRDTFLDFPRGADIIWPPTYTWIVVGLLAPWAPEDPQALRAFVERGTASLPFLWGVLASLVAAAAGLALAGPAAGLAAGLLHALAAPSVAYSCLGNGDHHAFVALLGGALLWVWTLVQARDVLDDRRRAWRWGALAGLLAGLLQAVWVPSLLYLLLVEALLAWWLLRHARSGRAGFPGLALAYHAAALVVLLPAVLASPFRESSPWSTVVLSWFQPALLAVGLLAFAPLVWLRPGSAGLRRYPWLAAGAGLAAAAALFWLDIGPARGLRAGLAVVGRDDAFTTSILESRPLIGQRATLSVFFRTLGLGVLLLPLAWAAAAREALARRREVLLPWAAAGALFALLAARQYRFADALALPMAVLLGWGWARALRWAPLERLAARLPRFARAAALVLLVALCQYSTSGEVLARGLGDGGEQEQRDAPRRAARRMYEWLAGQAAAPQPGAVLATWDRGHEIAWVARKPAVATNFGPYAGGDGFRLPARFYLEQREDLAERLLADARVRYVLAPSDLPSRLPGLARIAGPDAGKRVLRQRSRTEMAILPAFYRTMAARLVLGAAAGRAPDGSRPRPPPFLRLVHVSAQRVKGRRYGWIFERVAGAVLQARAAPGERLGLRLELDYPGRRQPWLFEAEAIAGKDGLARLRVPYSTDGANGDGRARGPARWTLGDRSGQVDIPVAAVRDGSVLDLDAP